MAYTVNYNDERFTQVETDKQEALTQVENTYNGLIDKTDQYYQAQIDASKEYADKQTELQNQQTEFAIDKIEQEKANAEKDYIKEQSGAYVDWQKQSNPYGVKSEQMAAGGLAGSGYSESSQVSMYNTYQNRVATAREAFTRIVADFTNAMTEARLKNSVALAEIAYQAQQQQLELSLQGFQYRNQLLLEMANKKTETENIYYQRYQDVLQQINQENALAEEIRQYNESLAFQKEQAAADKAYKNAQLALQREQFNWQKSQASSSGGGSSIKKSSSSKTSTGSKKSSGGSSSVSKSSTPTFSTYKEAAEYMQKTGIASGDGGLMTKNEWLRRKASGSNRAETSYGSYSEYLTNFVAWRAANPS